MERIFVRLLRRALLAVQWKHPLRAAPARREWARVRAEQAQACRVESEKRAEGNAEFREHAKAAEAAIRVAELESELDAIRVELEIERTGWTGTQSA